MPDPNRVARLPRLRWRMYAILVAAYVLVYFHRMAPGVVASELQHAFDASSAALGGLAAAYFYRYAAMHSNTSAARPVRPESGRGRHVPGRTPD